MGVEVDKVIIMAFFGIFILAPVNLWVLWETRKPEPNMALVQKLMRVYLAITALEAPATAMATASNRPSCASFKANVC